MSAFFAFLFRCSFFFLCFSPLFFLSLLFRFSASLRCFFRFLIFFAFLFFAFCFQDLLGFSFFYFSFAFFSAVLIFLALLLFCCQIFEPPADTRRGFLKISNAKTSGNASQSPSPQAVTGVSLATWKMTEANRLLPVPLLSHWVACSRGPLLEVSGPVAPWVWRCL